MTKQTIYVNGFGKRELYQQTFGGQELQYTRLVIADILAIQLIRHLAEALELIDQNHYIRLTINHGNVRDGINLDPNPSEWHGVIVDAPRLK